jgi:cytoskeletal protein RodZ
MLARIEQGMADRSGHERSRVYRRRRQASWLRVTLAVLAAAGALGLGGLAVAAGVRQQAPLHPAPVVVTPPSQSAGAAPQPRSSATKPSASPSTSPSRHPVTPTSDGPISARADVNAHSTVYWSQNDLTVEVGQPLTALTVEMRVAQTGGVQTTGDWQTAPSGDFTISVAPSDGYLVYRWTLKPGRTIPAAQQLFGAPFNHATGKRDAGKDTFRVEAVAAGRTFVVGGGFPAGG